MRKLSRLTIVFLLLGLVALNGEVQARASKGVNPLQLTSAGWYCMPVPLGVGCFPPPVIDKLLSGDVVLNFLLFDTNLVTDEEAPFIGTVILLRDDKYHGQPCPTEGADEWGLVNIFGVDYRACHHFELPLP